MSNVLMMVSKKASLHSHCRLILYHRRTLHIKPESVVIVSAVRTPWGRYQGQLSSAPSSYLKSVILDAAVKQSAVPVELVKQIYMAETCQRQGDADEVNVLGSFLKRATFSRVSSKADIDFKAILMGLDHLKSKPEDVLVVGGTESATDNQFVKEKEAFENKQNETIGQYASDCIEKHTKAQREGLFDAEIIPVQVIQQSGQRKRQQEVAQDEVSSVNSKIYEEINYSDGSAAVVLTTFAQARELNLKPLAVVKDFEYNSNSHSNVLSSVRNCVDQVLNKSQIDPQQIEHWEISDCVPQDVLSFMQHFNINLDLINPHGGCLCFGKPSAAASPRMLTHLAHSLYSSQYGCLVSHNSGESLAILIEKLPLSSPSVGLPHLTLYTKDHCHLCDMLLEELEINFSGEYDLEKVYIDTKENVRFLRLYRHDIPVVFLNGQFLCMHRLNNRLLRRKLDLLKQL